MTEFYGVVLGSKTNPPQCDREGKLLFFATKQEAREWAKRKPYKSHVVPLDLETIMRQQGNLIGLALLELQREGSAAPLISAIVEISAKLDKISEQCPQVAEVCKIEDKGD